MIPLIDLPELVKHYAPHFKTMFSAGEYEHFKRYLSGLLVSENKTVTAINSLFVLESKDQKVYSTGLMALFYPNVNELPCFLGYFIHF